MQVRWILSLLLLAGVTGCGGGFPLSVPRWTKGADASGSAAAGSLDQYQHPAGGSSPSFWQRPFAWLRPGKEAAENSMPNPPGTISPDDPLSLRNTPQDIGADIYVKAAQLYESHNNLDRAAGQYQLALEIAPEDPAILVAYARLLDRQGKFDEAIARYSEAGHKQPENASIRNDLGLCLARQGQVDLALRELEYAVSLRPQETLYRNNIAKVLVEVGRPEEALNHMVAVHPPAVAHYNVGFLLYEKQQHQAAAHHFQRALEIDRAFVKAERMLQLMSPAPAVAARPAPGPTGYGPATPPPGPAPRPQLLPPTR